MYFYPHHIGDFIKDTHFLTNEEVGIYLKLIWLYYDTEKPLPNSLNTLSMKVNCRDNKADLLGILQTFFILIDDEWHHSRCDQEIEQYHGNIDQKSKAGKASAEKRRLQKLALDEQKNNKSLTGVEQALNKCNTDEQLTKNQEPLTKNQLKTITPDGVSDSVFADYMEVRKSKKAKWTKTVLDGLNREASKAGLTLEQVMILCCERNWQSFNADWILKDKSISQRITSFKERDAALAANQLQSMMLGMPMQQERSEGCIFDIEVSDAKRIS